MGLIVITPAAAEPLTLGEAQAHCRVDDAAHDAVLLACIAGARAKCEGLTQKLLIRRTVEQNYDDFPGVSELKLRGAPAVSIVSISYTDTAGGTQIMAPGTYTLDATNVHEPWILPAYGTVWPATQPSINAVRVRYLAGFGTAGANVPDDIRAWLRLTVGYLFAQREAFDATGRISDIPSRFADSLLDPWRYYGT